MPSFLDFLAGRGPLRAAGGGPGSAQAPVPSAPPQPLPGYVEAEAARSAPDYDMAAAKAAGVKPDPRGHYPDTYKLPNHATFSDESIYSKPGSGPVGGTWIPNGQPGGAFQPSPLNRANMPGAALQNYFKRVEPDATLLNPPAVGPGRYMPAPLRGPNSQ